MSKGHIKRHKDRWCGIAYNKYEKKYNYVYDKNKKICEDKLKELVKRIELDHYNLKNEHKNKDKLERTFSETYDEWVDNRIDIIEDTKNDYRSVKKCHFQEFNNMKIKDIDEVVIQKFYNSIIKKYGVKKLDRIDKFFGKFIRYLYKNRIITVNYMDFIEKPKQTKIKHINVTNADYKNILSLLKKEDYQLYMLTVLTGCTGLRIGEALGLEKKCIFLKEKVIKISKQVTFEKGKGYILSDRLKTENSYRTIPIIDFVADELKEYIIYIESYINKCKLVNPDFQLDNDLLFINSNGNLIPTNTADRKWRQFKKNNNINEKIRIHDLRRYFATYMMKNNVPDTVAKDILGHADINMTVYYQNDDIDIQKEFISNLNFKLDV